MIMRRATLDDLGAITDIYNEAIVTTVATFDTETKSLEEQKAWFAHHGEKHPVLVAEEDGVITGWASLSAYSDRCAYAETAEISLYIRKEFRGKGIGKKLTQRIIEEGKAAGLHSLLARIAAENEVSIRLAKAAGFERVGVMREVGCKFGRRLDVEILQYIYR